MLPETPLSHETPLSQCRKNLFAFVSLFLLILITYSNTFDASWHFDDENNILKNKPLHLTELNIQNIKKTFFADWNGSGKLYRPVACFSFALNYYFGGTEVYGYHLINLIIHFLSSFFLFLFVYHTLNFPILKARYGPNAYFIALFSAVLWAINPVQTQAVTYVVQRMASMAGMFSIMAMYFYLKGRTSAPKSLRGPHFFLCIVCSILAIGSKENAVMLPMVILIYDLFLIQGVTKKNIQRYSFFLLIVILISLVLALLIAGPSIFNPKSLISGYQNRGFTLSERLLTEPRVILFYISLLLYPMPNRLCFEHDIPLSISLFTPLSTILSIVAILLALCLTVRGARKWPFISFCIIFFFLNHLIEASVFPIEIIFEHRNYLPSMLFFAPIAILLLKGIELFSSRKALQALLIIFLILVPIGWGHSTFVRNMAWKTDESLYLDCVEKYPDLARPHNNLGSVYGKKHLYQKAIDEYLIALSKKNDNNLVANAWIYHNLGSIYQKLGKDEKAMFYYDQAFRFQPLFSPSHINKGIILMKNDHYDKAESEFRKAIKGNKNLVLAYGNLGFLLIATGQTDEGIINLKKAVEKNPHSPEAIRMLGLAYKLKDKAGKAIIYLKKALTIDPNDPLALLHLAHIYFSNGMNGQKDEAMACFFDICDGDPIRIKQFIHFMLENACSKGALLSQQKPLLTFLGTECARKSKEYGYISDYCVKKKGEPTSRQVRPFKQTTNK